VDWMLLAQDTDQWLTFVNTVMNLRAPSKAGISKLSERPLVSQVGLCPMKLVYHVSHPSELNHANISRLRTRIIKRLVMDRK